MQRIALEEIIALPLDEASLPADFASFVARHNRFAFCIAYALLRNPHDAEDVVQETFLKLYRNHGWRGLKDEQAFLARCTWRLAQTYRGSARPTEPMPQEPASAAAGPEQLALSADSTAYLHRIIDSLPEELRQPLALSAVEELNSRQIARILGIPEGTVRTRIQRARQLLKEKLAREEVRHG